MTLRQTTDFLLYQWLALEQLIQRERFTEHSRETFDAVLDTCERIAREKFAPFNRTVDTEEPKFDGEKVTLPQATHDASKAYAESGMLSAAQDYDIGANWKLLVENSFDDYHLLTTHATWLDYMKNAGVEMKRDLAEFLAQNGHQVTDLGTHAATPPVDYPDISAAVSEAVRSGQADRGVVICGSGAGAAIAASKFPGIRASVVHDDYTARQAVEHDSLNVLCLGARILEEADAWAVTELWLAAPFEGDRHARRVALIETTNAASTRNCWPRAGCTRPCITASSASPRTKASRASLTMTSDQWAMRGMSM